MYITVQIVAITKGGDLASSLAVRTKFRWPKFLI